MRIYLVLPLADLNERAYGYERSKQAQGACGWRGELQEGLQHTDDTAQAVL